MESEFARNLEQGRFLVPVCTRCGKKTWPPSSTCPLCYSKTKLRKVNDRGVLVEFASSRVKGREGFFGIVEMDGFRLMGSFQTGKLTEGMKVRMVACGKKDGAPYYLFDPE